MTTDDKGPFSIILMRRIDDLLADTVPYARLRQQESLAARRQVERDSGPHCEESTVSQIIDGLHTTYTYKFP